jgi:hypothetical protein
MDLTKEIYTQSSIPHIIDEGIICLNTDVCNMVFNMGTICASKKNWDRAIGVWKIKQLKK